MKIRKHAGQRTQRGFTLMELMIVVSIVGILAAVSLPLYQEYVIRARVTELLHLTATGKNIVTENIAHNGAIGAAQNCRSFSNITPATANVASISCADSTGVIELKGTAKVKDVVVLFTPTVSAGGIVWTCSTTSDEKYVPTSCRS